MKNFFAIFILSLSFNAFSFVTLDVGIIHKKGIDKGLVLDAELYTREDFRPEHRRIITTKDGIRFEFVSHLLPDPGEEGPSVLIEVEGLLIHSDGRLIKKFKRGDLIFKLGEEKTFEYSQIEGQLIKLELKADLQKQ